MKNSLKSPNRKLKLHKKKTKMKIEPKGSYPNAQKSHNQYTKL